MYIHHSPSNGQPNPEALQRETYEYLSHQFPSVDTSYLESAVLSAYRRYLEKLKTEDHSRWHTSEGILGYLCKTARGRVLDRLQKRSHEILGLDPNLWDDKLGAWLGPVPAGEEPLLKAEICEDVRAILAEIRRKTFTTPLQQKLFDLLILKHSDEDPFLNIAQKARCSREYVRKTWDRVCVQFHTLWLKRHPE